MRETTLSPFVTLDAGKGKNPLDIAVEAMLAAERERSRFDWITRCYGNMLLDRKVVVVGGAANLISLERLARFISTDDLEDAVFVQVNGHALTNPRLPVNVLYHTCVAQPNIDPKFLSSLKVLWNDWQQRLDTVFLNLVDGDADMGNREFPLYLDFILALRDLSPRTNIGFFAQGEWEGENPYGWQHEWLNRLHKKFNCKLFTGLLALADVLRYEPSQVFLCGMDLFVDRTEGKLDGFVESHAIRGNVEFVVQAAQDPRVVIDVPLVEALARYGF